MEMIIVVIIVAAAGAYAAHALVRDASGKDGGCGCSCGTGSCGRKECVNHHSKEL